MKNSIGGLNGGRYKTKHRSFLVNRTFRKSAFDRTNLRQRNANVGTSGRRARKEGASSLLSFQTLPSPASSVSSYSQERGVEGEKAWKDRRSTTTTNTKDGSGREADGSSPSSATLFVATKRHRVQIPLRGRVSSGILPANLDPSLG